MTNHHFDDNSIADREPAQEPADDLGPQTPAVTVLVIDDHAGYRAVAGSVINAVPGFNLVGMAADGTEAVRLLASLRPPPDLVLLDVNLGDQSGVTVSSALTETNPDLKVLLLSAMAEDELPVEARRCGAAGYVPKVTFSPATLRLAWQGAYDWQP